MSTTLSLLLETAVEYGAGQARVADAVSQISTCRRNPSTTVGPADLVDNDFQDGEVVFQGVGLIQSEDLRHELVHHGTL